MSDDATRVSVTLESSTTAWLVTLVTARACARKWGVQSNTYILKGTLGSTLNSHRINTYGAIDVRCVCPSPRVSSPRECGTKTTRFSRCATVTLCGVSCRACWTMDTSTSLLSATTSNHNGHNHARRKGARLIVFPSYESRPPNPKYMIHMINPIPIT